MGGHALKGLDGKSITTRLLKEYYEKVKKLIFQSLSQLSLHTETVLELPGKEDFGDLDVLYVPPSGNPSNFNIQSIIQQTFQPTMIKKNGSVHSFDFDCTKIGLPNGTKFQIDMISVAENLDCSRFYLSYGDLGAILGRMFKKHGVVFGEAGLWCELSESTLDDSKDFWSADTLGKIPLTSDPRSICQFASLDYDEWEKVFPTLAKGQQDVIFAWLTKSRLFFPDSFQVMHRDVRPMYKSFMEFVAKNFLTNNDNSEEEGDKKKQKGVDDKKQKKKSAPNLQLEAIKLWKKEAEMKECIANAGMRLQRGKKFSGQDLMKAFRKIHSKNLVNKSMGPLLKEFQSAKGTPFTNYLDSKTREEILLEVDAYVQNMDLTNIETAEEEKSNDNKKKKAKAKEEEDKDASRSEEKAKEPKMESSGETKQKEQKWSKKKSGGHNDDDDVLLNQKIKENADYLAAVRKGLQPTNTKKGK